MGIDTWKSVCLFSLTAVCWFATPAVAGDDREILIDRALNLSGVSEQLKSLHLAVFSAVSADAFPDRRSRKQAKSIMQKAAGGDVLLPLIRASLRADFDRGRIEEVIGFFDSDPGRKVGRLIRRAAAPEVLDRVWKNHTMTRKLKEPRLQILRRIMKAEQVTELSADLVNEVIRGLTKASLDHKTDMGPATRERRKKLNRVGNKVRSDKEFTREIALPAFAHTYRSLSDAQLEALAVYQESDAARWFRITVQKGLENAAYHAGRSLAAALNRVGPKARKGPAREAKPPFW